MNNKNRYRGSGTLPLAGLFSLLLTAGCNGEDSKDYNTLCNQAHEEWLTCMDKTDVSQPPEGMAAEGFDSSDADMFFASGNIEKVNTVVKECTQAYSKKLADAAKLLTPEEKETKKAAFEETANSGIRIAGDLSECNAKDTGKEKFRCARNLIAAKRKEKLCQNSDSNANPDS